jgi:hypothetical protein
MLKRKIAYLHVKIKRSKATLWSVFGGSVAYHVSEIQIPNCKSANRKLQKQLTKKKKIAYFLDVGRNTVL